jgi:hypothetical protein
MFVLPGYEASDRWKLLLPSSGYEMEEARPSAELIRIYLNKSSTFWK